MAHVALYRKYRSQKFEELVGQEHITNTLKAAIESSRIAQAFLFTGPRGTGKTSTARILARALNCEQGPTATPCGTCRLCVAIAAGQGGDVIEMDAASEAGVEEVRDLIESAQYAPMEGRYKIFVIDEVHDLSAKAFDALLKTIEEPPAHVVFILATTAYNKVPVTIRSRCQKYEFHRGSMLDLISQMEFVCKSEDIKYEPAAITAIARMADGGFRDALTLLEQAAITSDNTLTLEGVTRQLGLIDSQETDRILEAAISGNTMELVRAADESIRAGKEPRAVLESLLLRLSELTHAMAGLDEGIDPSKAATDHALAVRIGAAELLRLRSVLAEAHHEIRDVTLPRLWLELALLRLTEAPTTQPQTVATAPAPQATKPAPKQTAPKPTPKVAPTVNADAAATWTQVVQHLASRFPAAGKVIDGAFLSGVDGKQAVISFNNRFQYERVVADRKTPNKPSIKETLTSTFREVMGDNGWNLEFRLSDAHAQPTADAAVQLPAEGAELVKLVEQVFEVQPEQS